MVLVMTPKILWLLRATFGRPWRFPPPMVRKVACGPTLDNLVVYGVLLFFFIHCLHVCEVKVHGGGGRQHLAGLDSAPRSDGPGREGSPPPGNYGKQETLGSKVPVKRVRKYLGRFSDSQFCPNQFYR